jgi:hypothetical protein
MLKFLLSKWIVQSHFNHVSNANDAAEIVAIAKFAYATERKAVQKMINYKLIEKEIP